MAFSVSDKLSYKWICKQLCFILKVTIMMWYKKTEKLRTWLDNYADTDQLAWSGSRIPSRYNSPYSFLVRILSYTHLSED